MRALRSIVPFVLVFPFIQGCYAIGAAKFGPDISYVQELANSMYDARPEDLGPPRPEDAELVRRFGSDRFAGWLAVPLISSWGYQGLHKYVYAIGWFGGIWHLDLMAEWLRHENPQVRRHALAAFSRLTGQHFDNEADALDWWWEHWSEYPRYDPDEDAEEAKDKSQSKDKQVE